MVGYTFQGRARAQAVSRLLPVAAQVRSQDGSCSIWGGKSGIGAGFLQAHTSVSLSFIISPTALYSLIIPSSTLSLYGSTALCCALAAFSVSWSFAQSVRLPRRGISPPQGRYLHTWQHKHRINANRHSCLKWDWNPRSKCLSERRQFMF
jgi:hypothetical protein